MCSMLSDQSFLSSCSLEELEREICELAAHVAAATCRWLLLVAEFDRRRGWAEWGARSCAQWLSWRCSLGLVAAREHVRVARRLVELPLVREAFGRGELSYCKVRAITRVACPETEETLVELARHATGAQLEKLVRGYGQALTATMEGAQRAYARRGLTVHWDDEGQLVLAGRLPAEEGALVLAALAAAESAAGGGGGPAGDASAEASTAHCGASAEAPQDSDGDAARRADALVWLARAGLSGAVAPDAQAVPSEVVVHVDADTLAGESVRERCELDDGPALAPETARRLACDGAIVRIIERDGRPLSVGRRRRAVSAPLRRALKSRDRGCRFPGCTHTRFLHAHHIHHWARGGPTTLENLIQLCSYHHRLVHEGGFGVERAGKHGVRFRRPDGRLIAPVHPGQPARGPSLERQHRLRGLELDADTCAPRSLGDRLDYGIAVEGLLADTLTPT
jgi:hypothetical protein